MTKQIDQHDAATSSRASCSVRYFSIEEIKDEQ